LKGGCVFPLASGAAQRAGSDLSPQAGRGNLTRRQYS
jgi:hypothetical protein